MLLQCLPALSHFLHSMHISFQPCFPSLHHVLACDSQIFLSEILSYINVFPRSFHAAGCLFVFSLNLSFKPLDIVSFSHLLFMYICCSIFFISHIMRIFFNIFYSHYWTTHNSKICVPRAFLQKMRMRCCI